MNPATDLFLSSRPAWPWSLPVAGPLLLALVAAALVAFTVWVYRGHPEANRRRLLLVVALRLVAMLLAVLTCLRPSVGFQDVPKVPSHLVIGVDLSESMSVRDEFGGQARIDAVRKVLAKCEGVLNELRTEQNCEVVVYGFGRAEFDEAADKYDPKAPANHKRTDIGAYLLRTGQRWQGERFVRAHILISDGRDNGLAVSAVGEAGRWRTIAPLHTFVVGDPNLPIDAKDVAIADVTLDPDPVAIKNPFTLRMRVNAFGFAGAKVPVVVQFDLGDGKGYVTKLEDTVTLANERDNAIELPLRAPEELPKGPDGKERRQIKVRVEIPAARVPGDSNAANNVVETYLNLNKEGLRLLVVDRLRPDAAQMLDALTADKRIDVRKVDLQTAEGGADLLPAFDFDDKAYDVMIVGNVSAKQFTAIDPKLPEKIAARVRDKGMGLMFLGGHATLGGTPGFPNAGGWSSERAIADLLPVTLPPQPRELRAPKSGYQVVPNVRYADSYLMRLAGPRDESAQLWDRLNDANAHARLTAVSPVEVRPTASVYAWASPSETLDKPIEQTAATAAKLDPLLVAGQSGSGSEGRVLVFTAQDTMLWQHLGHNQPTRDGKQIHSRFWRQLVLWLAKQEEEEGAAFARPEFSRLPVGSKQGVKIGLRGPNGAEVIDPKFTVKIAGPNETFDTAKEQPVLTDQAGGQRVATVPTAAGEYSVRVVAEGKTAAGVAVSGEATAQFLVYPETSDEMQQVAADYDQMQKLASAGGGQFHRLDDLPAFLRDLKNAPIDTLKPKPKYLPDWRRDAPGGFLPLWLTLFALALGGEWLLRRLWGLM